MQKLFWKMLQVGCAAALNTLLVSSITQAADPKVAIEETGNSIESVTLLAQIDQYSQVTDPLVETDSVSESSERAEEPSGMEQVTNVSQLRDVSPGDWAYEALRSLVERYGCIAGYPDGTYRGNRAMTRYEFAAGLNACLQQIERLIGDPGNTVTREDFETLQRLVNEFSTELATLGGRVDNLDGRVAFLEKNQFSTTTKFSAEIITFVSDAFGENADDVNSTIANYRVRFNFDTSFTGKDRLRVRLQGTNYRQHDTGATQGGFSTDNNGNPVFGQTGETRLLPTTASSNGNLTLHQLQYQFPVGDRLRIYLEAARTDPSFITDTITPFVALSNFGQGNPIYFPIGSQGGIGANIAITDNLSLDLGYLGEIGSANNPDEDFGIFNGGYIAFGQLVYRGERLKVGLLYLNSYSQKFGVDTFAGSNAAKVTQVIGADAFSNPVVANNYGVQVNYRFSPRFELGGWVGYTAARALGNIKGDADVWNYAMTLSFPDLGKKGNFGGIVLGMQPRLTGTSNSALAQAIGLPDGQRKDRDVGFHIEAFYRFQLNSYISITPGFIWLTAPNHDERNPDAVIGVIRTSFTF